MQTGTETVIHGTTSLTIREITSFKRDDEGPVFYVREIVIEARDRRFSIKLFSDNKETLGI